MTVYRINLYRERADEGQRLRRGLLQSLVLGVVIGLELGLIVLLAVSGNLLRERAGTLATSVQSLRSQDTEVRSDEPVRVARSLAQLRTTRVDWALVLEGVAESLPEDLALNGLEGGLRIEGGSDPGLDLQGRIGDTDADLNRVLSFVEDLRKNPKVSRFLPAVNLETVESERTKTFTIICRRSGGKR